ncbi:C_GCAxxG_C_C family protein [Alkalidesulfovibrio alkalitolerans DSM 16529]|jgi:C_GCAxxG_C_C family probable redox protein|uniref:C_GCAxxG_C_C family protein n=2 Tax=Alkalidesulfovibrio alkalitolerans TaxID=293256 RepID=S7TDZ4_9BACT|nr:C_GCAxxG_C_C family protein [Alkalidesulfovibrio alkalitolerans DSM 16529]
MGFAIGIGLSDLTPHSHTLSTRDMSLPICRQRAAESFDCADSDLSGPSDGLYCLPNANLAPGAAAVRERARNLYESRRMLCAEAVLAAVNEGFDCGLSEEQAVALTAALPVGLGGSGCLCGAVSGGAVALGLLLAREPRCLSRAEIRKASARLHDDFKKAYGSTCCRVLCKKVKDDRKAHFAQCANLTAVAAGAAVSLAIELRPELGEAAVQRPLARDNRLTALVKRLRARF